jgi:hypothetical protein
MIAPSGGNENDPLIVKRGGSDAGDHEMMLKVSTILLCLQVRRRPRKY